MEPKAGLTFQGDDLSDAAKSAGLIKGADAVISAYAPPKDNPDELVAATRRLVEAIRKSGVSRFLMVGGAGGLEVAPGVSLIASGHLPPEWLPISKAHVNALAVLQASPDIDWTYVAPSAYFDPGERTGIFRVGTDKLLADSNGNSSISMEDYAIAMVDELEKGEHRRMRITVGY